MVNILMILKVVMRTMKATVYLKAKAYHVFQFSRSVMSFSDSLQPHELQHARPPCPSPTPRVHPNPCPSSQWCHPTISSSVIPFSCPQSFPASESFPVNHLFASGGQSKFSSGHRTGKGQFSFQSLRKATPKNAQTTTQLHSSHTLVK